MKILIILALLLSGITFLSADVTDDFVEAITSAKFEKAEEYYSPELAEALQKGKLEFVWKGLIRNTGDFEVVVESKREDREDFYSVVSTLKFENVYMDMVMTANKDEQISGLFFRPSQYTGDLEQIPAYVDSTQFIAEEVEFDCQGYKMYGTLIIPKKSKKFSHSYNGYRFRSKR